MKEQVCMCLTGHKWEKGKRERWMTKCDKRMGVALGGGVLLSVCVCVCVKVRDMFLYSCMQVHGFPSVSLHLCLTHTYTNTCASP